jgi:hypothetical protein
MDGGGGRLSRGARPRTRQCGPARQLRPHPRAHAPSRGGGDRL